jgi:hypothetical protein
VSSDGFGSPTVTSKPTPPKKPKLQEARLQGVYRLHYIQLTSNVSFLPEHDSATWRISSRCKTGGGCDLKIHSKSGHYDVKAAFVKGKYRFSRAIPKSYTCGSGGNVDYYITEVRSDSFRVKRMKLIKDEWVATQLQGLEDEDGTRGCGLTGSAHTRYAIRMIRSG